MIPAEERLAPDREEGMPVETPSLFAQVIRDHLDLKERNAQLDERMPIDRYKVEDPFSNHPLFKTEEQARIEETLDGVEPDFSDASLENALAWPVPAGAADEQTAENVAQDVPEESGFWSTGTGVRDFDWGD
jgi:hypothetical protein